MELFVCSTYENDPNPSPDEWDEWDGYTIVLAENEEEAKSISECDYVKLVDTSKAVVLFTFTEPNMGDDL